MPQKYSETFATADTSTEGGRKLRERYDKNWMDLLNKGRENAIKNPVQSTPETEEERVNRRITEERKPHNDVWMEGIEKAKTKGRSQQQQQQRGEGQKNAQDKTKMSREPKQTVGGNCQQSPIPKSPIVIASCFGKGSASGTGAPKENTSNTLAANASFISRYFSSG